MSDIPKDLKYTRSHEWVRVEGDRCVVGITDHAQRELTDLVYVELPEPGRQVTAGEACAVVESVKTASDILAPLGGKVVAVNEDVKNDPALVNRDPYGVGWLLEIRPGDAAALEGLLDASAYAAAIGA
ncbi:MAG TPA: glycine cleavage system protein GcvH [Verrucomicrobiota bacterium]|nr:glycine cleavage system protein GcvH [Verrucomicrobiota bacterium]HNU51734.1 glycine cleavage system protein GcvH [Verrucomicrobiota bacterium]